MKRNPRVRSVTVPSGEPGPAGQLLTHFINTLMSAQAVAVCPAPYGQASPDWL